MIHLTWPFPQTLEGHWKRQPLVASGSAKLHQVPKKVVQKSRRFFAMKKSCYSCCVVFFGWTLKLLTCLTLTACTIPRWPTKEHPTTFLGQDKTVENSHARSVSGWRRQKPLLFGVATMPMRLTLWWNKKHPVMKNPWQILGWWVLMTFEGCFFFVTSN